MRHSSCEFECSDFYFTLNEIYLDELWLAFGIGSNVRYLHTGCTYILEVVANKDARICATLPMFHAHHFVAEARRQLAINGKFILKSLKHLKSFC